MNDPYKNIIKSLVQRMKDIKDGVDYGWTTGFPLLDDHVGRLEAGQMWVVGGYTGTGKSYFLLNLVDGMLKEWKTKKQDDKYDPPKVAIFSTELSAEDYVLRHVLMRGMRYNLDLKKYRATIPDKVIQELENYYQERFLNPDSLRIFGGIESYEQLEERFKSLVGNVNVVIVDYIQELSIDGKYEEKDIMPILARKFKSLAMNYGVAVILISQMNLYSMGRDHDISKTQIPAFSFGKQLNAAAHTSIVLTRDKVDGKLEKKLNVNIMKARSGNLGTVALEILDGYKLIPIKMNHGDNR